MEDSLPLWLNPVADVEPARTRVSKAQRELEQIQFESIFETVLDKVSSGYTVAAALREDHRPVNRNRFDRWVKSDPERVQRYKDAVELQTYAWADKMIETAEDGLIEPTRAKVINDTYKFLMGAHNRRVYGQTQQIEISQNISIVRALEAAQGRLIEHEEGEE